MQQSIVTISPKSQVVIPKSVRAITHALKPGTKVIVHPLTAGSILIEEKPKDWVEETYGMQKQLWKGINTTKYIDQLRQSWHKTG